MKNTQRGFISIILILIVVVALAGGVYYFSQRSEIKTAANQSWNAEEITYNDKVIKANSIPAMLVQKDTVFEMGKDAEFKDVKFSPNGAKVAFAGRNPAHDFGWVYDFTTSTFIPLAFQYGGGVEVVGWKNDNEVTLKLTSPKPETTEKTFDLKNLPEYPKIDKE